MSGLDVLLVGWDGADPDWLESESGNLPTFSELKAKGRWGRLESTVPPVTAPAWASLHTGANPGKHGVFGWATRRPGSYLPSLANSASIALPTLWELLSQRVRVGVVGFPLTHPAREVNGFWLPGLLSPRDAPGHPPGLVRQVLARFPHWQPTPPEWAKGEDAEGWSRELAATTTRQAQVALFLARRFRPQVLGIHFQTTDTVQHYLWGQAGVRMVFQAADRALARLVEALRPRLVVLLSDHGMGPVVGEFHLNTWLWREGFLTLRRRGGSRLRARLFERGWNPRGLEHMAWRGYRIARRLGFLDSWADAVHGESRLARLVRWGFLSLADVDWEKTWAYSHSEIGSIFLNRVGREPRGIVTPGDATQVLAELTQALGELRTPEGEPVVERVLLGEDLYRGPHAPLGPDLLFLSPGLRWMGKGLGGFLSQQVFTPPAVRGGHRLQGALLLSGEGVQPGLAPHARLWDVAPTVLAYLGVPIPSWMDGQPLEELFEPGSLKVSRQEATAEARQRPSQDTIERLKGLGYL